MKLLTTIILIGMCLSSGAQSAAERYDVTLDKLNNGATVKDVFATLDEVLAMDSTFENAYFLKAFVYYKLEAFQAAIEEYNFLLRVNPYHKEALKNRALTRIQVYDLEGAIDDHNRRLVLEPLNPSIYHDRAYCKGLLNDVAGSIEDYTKALELNPGFTEAFANRGKAKMNLLTTSMHPLETVSVEDACRDLNRARIMGDTSGLKLISIYCEEISLQP